MSEWTYRSDLAKAPLYGQVLAADTAQQTSYGLFNALAIPKPSDMSATSIPETALETSLERNLAEFSKVKLQDITNAALLNRIDSKYIFSQNLLKELLPSLREDYQVLSVANSVVQDYQTLYFDDAHFSLYQQHHAGRLGRYKLRSRSYVASNVSFLEIKYKNNKGRTDKKRVITPHLCSDLSHAPQDFLTEHFPYEASGFKARLENRFKRITLVHKVKKERVTLDVAISFASPSAKLALEGVVIAELKQDYRQGSSFAHVMKAAQLRNASFSKYSIGTSLLYPVKRNNFKSQLHLLSKIQPPVITSLSQLGLQA